MFRSCRVSKQIVLLLLLALNANADCLQQPTDLEVGKCYEKEGNKNLAKQHMNVRSSKMSTALKHVSIWRTFIVR